MIAKMNVLKMVSKNGISPKTNKPYSINELRCIDSEFPEELVVVRVHESLVESARSLEGKTVNMHISYKAGNFNLQKSAA